MNEVLPAVELALSDTWGATVKLTLQETLANRRHIARLAVSTSAPNTPKTLILKRWRSEGDEGFDPHSFATALLNEWASLDFISGIFGAGSLTPQLYTGDKDKGFLVMEDLAEGKTLEKILQGNDRVQAEKALIQYGEVLGKLHARTLGQHEVFSAIQSRLGLESSASYEPLPALQAALKTVKDLNFDVRPATDNDLQEAATHLSHLAAFSVLHHGDPAPNNTWIDNTGRLYLFDFESAHFDHAFLEGVNPRMGFPTWGMLFVNRIPENIWRQTEAAYLNTLATRFPEAADASLYGAIIASACASWTLVFCARWLETALIGELPPLHRHRLRQIAISRIESFVQASQDFKSLSNLGETFTRLLGQLRSQWPVEEQSLPLFPVFQASKS